jgi:hypothetical protein
MSEQPKKVADLEPEAQELTLAEAEDAEGGVIAIIRTQTPFEIKDFSFAVENPTTIGSATGGSGAGRTE